MDHFNNLLNQITEVFRSMTPAARVTSALLMVTIVVSVAFLFQAGAEGEDELFLDGRTFTSPNIAALEAAFAKGNLNGSRVVGYRIYIPKGLKDSYLKAAAEDNAMPPELDADIRAALTPQSPWSTSSKAITDRRLHYGRETQTARTLQMMRPYDFATVRFDEEQISSMPRKVEKTASATVRGTGGQALTVKQIREIRTFVASQWSGLMAKNVTVTDMTTGDAHSGGGMGATSANGNPYLTAKQMFEDMYRDNIYERLKMYEGIVVQVNVDLDDVINLQTHQQVLDAQPITLKSQETTLSSTDRRPRPQGQPGAGPNGVGPGNNPRTLAQSNSDPDSTVKETTASTEAATGTKIIRSEKANFVPNRVTASIGVPRDLYAKTWKDRQASLQDGTPDAIPDPGQLQEIEQQITKVIEDSVIKLMPLHPAGVDPYPQVVVRTFDDISPAFIPDPGITNHATSWLASNWQTIGMMLMGGFSLLMLRNLVTKPLTPPKTFDSEGRAVERNASGGSSNSSATTSSASDGEPIYENALKKRFKSSGPNLKSELAEVVREDPDAAANVLRQWIDTAAA
ncbi:MAG: flagellar M-ring protein FliF [Pirellulaceae bacterium]|jgi:flagellar M-ring protein FliF